MPASEAAGAVCWVQQDTAGARRDTAAGRPRGRGSVLVCFFGFVSKKVHVALV